MAHDDIAWQWDPVLPAGLAILRHPDWASFEDRASDRGIVYQRFGAANGMVFLSYGPDSTPEWQLQHVGREALTTVSVETDETVDVLGTPARRIVLHVHHARTGGHARGPRGPQPLPALGDEIFVFVGLARGNLPILVGYRMPLAEQAAFEPLLEHIIGNVRSL